MSRFTSPVFRVQGELVMSPVLFKDVTCFVSGHVHHIKKRGRLSYSSCVIDEEIDEKMLSHLPSSLEMEPWFTWHQQGCLLPLISSASRDFH